MLDALNKVVIVDNNKATLSSWSMSSFAELFIGALTGNWGPNVATRRVKGKEWADLAKSAEDLGVDKADVFDIMGGLTKVKY